VGVTFKSYFFLGFSSGSSKIKTFTILKSWTFIFVAPPNSFKDSNGSLEVKIVEEKGVGVRSLVRNTSRVKRACWNSRMGTKMSDKQINYSYKPA